MCITSLVLGGNTNGRASKLVCKTYRRDGCSHEYGDILNFTTKDCVDLRGQKEEMMAQSATLWIGKRANST
jgi:hypothetical protein